MKNIRPARTETAINTASRAPIYTAISAAILSVLGVNGAVAQAGSEFLEEVIVTAAPRAVSKFDSTVSINTVSADQMAKTAPRSAAEILRTIPGIRSEASAGEGNTNIAVRGVPIAAGGSKFVQLQEDGMPILLFGDIITATADAFLRVDSTIARVEAIKGSSAATMASNAPAGVINFISKTGEEEGGSIGVTSGLDYDLFRTDFEYGSPIGNSDWRFHVGGFYREGEGVRDVDFKASKGGQFKANLTKEFETGYIRFYLKHLDDKAPTYLPMPVKASQGSIKGLDASTSSNISRDLSDVLSIAPGGGRRTSSIEDGNTSESTAYGIDFENEVDDGLVVKERFRYAQTSGTFFGAFTASVGGTDDIEGISAALTGTGADGLAYVSGANAGVPLTADQLANLGGNGLLQNIRTFDSDLENLDNFTNDLSITKSFESMDLTVGYYKASQRIDVNWYWQTFLQDVSDEARLLDVLAGGVPLTQNGQLAYGAPDWGNCCARDTAHDTDVDAIYAAIHVEVTDDLSIDASLRYDSGDTVAHYGRGKTVARDVNGDGLTGAADGQLAEDNVTFNDASTINSSRFKYDWDYASYSLAANYVLNDSIALFGSAAKGGRVNVDRIGDVDGGSLISNGGGSVPNTSIENEVRTYEFGAKYNGDYVGVFTTLFYVETDDFNSDVKPGAGGAAGAPVVREYESLGLEVEAVAGFGDFDLRASLTWTDAEIVAANDASIIGNKPRRQADFVWSLSPSYQFNDSLSVGATLVGTTDAYSADNNTFEMDGYTYMNLYVDYALAENLNLLFTVNNVTDEFGLTEAEDGITTVRGVDYIRARSIAGRSSALKLQYTF